MKKIVLVLVTSLALFTSLSAQHVSVHATPHVTPHITTHVTPHISTTPHTSTPVHVEPHTAPVAPVRATVPRPSATPSTPEIPTYTHEPTIQLREIRSATENNRPSFFYLIKNNHTGKQDTVWADSKEALATKVSQVTAPPEEKQYGSNIPFILGGILLVSVVAAVLIISASKNDSSDSLEEDRPAYL